MNNRIVLFFLIVAAVIVSHALINTVNYAYYDHKYTVICKTVNGSKSDRYKYLCNYRASMKNNHTPIFEILLTGSPE